MKPTIEIIVTPAGEISIEGKNFKGPDCGKATRFIEEALGVVNTKVKKPEYHQRQTKALQQNLGQ